MIEHIIKITTEKRIKERLKYKNKNNNRLSRVGGQADEDVMYCSKCEQCWEYRKKGNGNKQPDRVLHYSNFVTFGKKRIICPLCKNNKTKKGLR